MAEPHRLSRAEARRIAVRAQLLDAGRPDDLHEVVRHLTNLQIDPIAAVAPSADLVLWSRLGSSYRPAELVAALEDFSLLELQGRIRPAEDIALHRAEMAQWRDGDLTGWRREFSEWVEVNEECRGDILERLRGDGPLTVRDLPDTTVVPWRSSGWTGNKNVAQLLGLMVRRGEVAVAGRAGRDGRSGRERLWDLAERVYPDEPMVPAEHAAAIRAARTLAAAGLARPAQRDSMIDPVGVGEAGEPAVVDGVRGEWRVDPDQLDRLGTPFRGRAALLSPLDRLVFDRVRLSELFEFDYQLEMYKPAAKRRWGYYALPILYGDRLVGKLDAVADRKEGAFVVHAVHRDTAFSPTMTRRIDAEIDDLARWLDLDLIRET